MYDHNAFNNYMAAVRSAAIPLCMEGKIYGSAEGCARLGREVGPALVDFSRDERDLASMVSSTYSGICIIAYRPRPPLDAGDWLAAVREGVRKGLETWKN